MITIIKLQNLFTDLSPRGMDQVFSDWEMLVGFGAMAECQPIVIAAGAEEIQHRVDPQHILVETQVEKNNAGIGRIYFAFPNELVIDIIGELMMVPDSVKEERSRLGLSENDVETFQEMANLLCGSWNRVFQDLERNLRISQSVDDLVVSASLGSSCALVDRIPEGRVAWVDTKIIAGDKTYRSLIVLPFDVALAVTEEFYATTDPRAARAS